jgi:hypothetical protein
MKNNTNKLIFEELKKASLLFNYDPKKTLSENIVEQTVGDKKFNFTANPEVGKGNITYNPTSPADMFKNAQAAVEGGLPSLGVTSGTTSSGTTSSGTTASGTTSGATSGTTSGTTSANELVYDYFYKQDKNYRYALTSDGKWFAKNIKNDKTFDLSSNPKFKKTIDNLNKGLENGQTKKHTFATNDPKNKVGELKLDTKIKLPTTKDLSAASGSGVTSGSTETNNGIVDSSAPENKTPVQGQIQGTISDDEEV